MHISGVDDSKNEIEEWVELKLNSVLYSHYSSMTNFGDMIAFAQEMKKMLYAMVRGSQNASSILPHLPFRPNPEKRCVEVAARQLAHVGGVVECQPNCFHVKWEEALYQAFAANCKLENRKYSK